MSWHYEEHKRLEKVEKVEIFLMFVLVAATFTVLAVGAIAILLGVCAAWGPCFS